MADRVRALVTGAGGFIGHHMVKYLKKKGYWVRGVDIKHPEYEKTAANEFLVEDLRRRDSCLIATSGISEVYHFAADMGGIGYITKYHAKIASNSSLINLHMLEAAHLNNVDRFFFSSSACVYPQYLQNTNEIEGLKEDQSMPADPEQGYGWEKLYAEKLCEYYYEDFGLETRVGRFHNIYGPLGTFEGGKEKAPAAICRKVALARDGEKIEIWGDGKQTRSFTYIDDCIEGVYRLTRSDIHEPINIGSDERVTIDELVDKVCGIAGKSLTKEYVTGEPQGVRGRNSDNSKVRRLLDWSPEVTLQSGLKVTYEWIFDELDRMGRNPIKFYHNSHLRKYQ